MKNALLVLLILKSIFIHAQTLQEFGSNEMKYWKLRGRLIGDENNRGKYNGSMVVGSGNRMSILRSLFSSSCKQK